MVIAKVSCSKVQNLLLCYVQDAVLLSARQGNDCILYNKTAKYERKLKILTKKYPFVFFNGSFFVEKKKFDKKIIGYDDVVQRPFAKPNKEQVNIFKRLFS